MKPFLARAKSINVLAKQTIFSHCEPALGEVPARLAKYLLELDQAQGNPYIKVDSSKAPSKSLIVNDLAH